MDYKQLTEKKEKLDSYRPLPKELVKNLTNWFRVELTYTSNAIEGNTLTALQIASFLEKNIVVGGKAIQEYLEVRNHAKAFDWILNFVQSGRTQITEKDILQIHKILSKGIDDIMAGEYRCESIVIGGQTIIPCPTVLPDGMADFVEILNGFLADLHPVKTAAHVHDTIMLFHPFSERNGLVARLLMNLVLMKNGYMPAVISAETHPMYLDLVYKIQTGESLSACNQLIIQAADESLDIYLNSLEFK